MVPNKLARLLVSRCLRWWFGVDDGVVGGVLVGSNREADDDDIDDDVDDPSEKAAGANWILGCEFALAISLSSSSSESLVAPSAENELNLPREVLPPPTDPMPAIPRMLDVFPEAIDVLWTLLAIGVLSEGAMEAAARARLLPLSPPWWETIAGFGRAWSVLMICPIWFIVSSINWFVDLMRLKEAGLTVDKNVAPSEGGVECFRRRCFRPAMGRDLLLEAAAADAASEALDRSTIELSCR
jgi:hypothetical protein